MHGLRSSIMVLIGLSLVIPAWAGVILHNSERALFRLDFESVDLSSATSLHYLAFAVGPDPTSPRIRSWQGQVRVFDDLNAPPVIGALGTPFADRLQIDTPPRKLPYLLDDPLSFVEIVFDGTGLTSTDPATDLSTAEFDIQAVAMSEGVEIARSLGTLAVMPTPASLALLGLGLIGLGYHQHRKVLERRRSGRR